MSSQHAVYASKQNKQPMLTEMACPKYFACFVPRLKKNMSQSRIHLNRYVWACPLMIIQGLVPIPPPVQGVRIIPTMMLYNDVCPFLGNSQTQNQTQAKHYMISEFIFHKLHCLMVHGSFMAHGPDSWIMTRAPWLMNNGFKTHE